MGFERWAPGGGPVGGKHTWPARSLADAVGTVLGRLRGIRRLGTALVTALVLTAGLGATAGTAGGADLPQCDTLLEVALVVDATRTNADTVDALAGDAGGVVDALDRADRPVRAAVASFEDYAGPYTYPGYEASYGAWGDDPWQLGAPLTGDLGAAEGALEDLAPGHGGDAADPLARALHEAGGLGWAPDSERVVVLATDAWPHDRDFAGENTGGDPGRDEIARTADDLAFEATVERLAEADVRVAVVWTGGDAGQAAARYAAHATGGTFTTLDGQPVADAVSDAVDATLGEPATRAGAVAASTVTNAPANPDVEIAPARVGPGPGEATAQAGQAGPAAGLSASGADASAATDHAVDRLAADATARVANATLLGGDVVVRGLEATAASSAEPGSAEASSTVHAGHLEVAGQVLEGDVPPNTAVPVPGRGLVVAHEVREDRAGDRAADVHATGLRAVAHQDGVRAETSLAEARAGVTCGPALGAVTGAPAGDVAADGDAGDGAENATPAPFPGMAGAARLAGSDTVDAWALEALPGEKLNVLVVPSLSTEAGVSDGDPSLSGGLGDLEVSLHEPGTYRERHASRDLPVHRLGLTADVAGDWILEVHRPADAPATNYTVATSVSPYLLSEQDDAGTGQDAPAPCQGAPAVGEGLTRGVLRNRDVSDTFSFTPPDGSGYEVTLKPGEGADDANFDLYLYDADCRLVEDSTSGGSLAGGTPEFIGPKDADGEPLFVEVRRVHGAANYYLDLRTTSPDQALAAGTPLAAG